MFNFSEPKNKKILNISWFIVFTLLLIALGSSKSGGLGSFGQYIGSKASGLLSTLSGGKKFNTLIKQEVVQEESVVTKVVEDVSPAVVSIVAKTVEFDYFSGPSRQESGIGTGFIVESSGLIVTNSHVVNNDQAQYNIVLKDGTTYEVEEIHLDELSDLAFLEVTARGLPTVSLGDSDVLKVGQQAIAIGNALGQFQNTVTVGVVSGVARQIQAGGGGMATKNYESVIQTDAALNPGNSGGPLLNSAGQVIGVNVASTVGADNISFAIPVNTLKPLLEGFLKEGKIVRPYIGVYYVMISKEIAQIRNLPEGAYISRVIKASPADKAGIKRGDIITEVDGKKLDSTLGLASVLSKQKVGANVDITIDREGKSMTMKVTLEEVPTSLTE